MNTDLNSQMGSPRAISGEGWAAITGIIGSALLLAKKLVSPNPAKAEPVSRAEFYAEMGALKDQIHSGQLTFLEKLDDNQRELLAVLERQATRINGLETGLARVDERTKE